MSFNGSKKYQVFELKGVCVICLLVFGIHEKSKGAASVPPQEIGP